VTLSTKHKAVIVAGCAAALSPMVVWGVTFATLAAGFAGIIAWGIAFGLVTGRARNG
jgi:hypothetical protein